MAETRSEIAHLRSSWAMYHLMDPFSHRIYQSRDFFFDEGSRHRTLRVEGEQGRSTPTAPTAATLTSTTAQSSKGGAEGKVLS